MNKYLDPYSIDYNAVGKETDCGESMHYATIINEDLGKLLGDKTHFTTQFTRVHGPLSMQQPAITSLVKGAYP